jgi:hypothetical protein
MSAVTPAQRAEVPEPGVWVLCTIQRRSVVQKDHHWHSRTLPESEGGNRYLMIFMDYFAEWPEVTTSLVTRLCRFKVPREFQWPQPELRVSTHARGDTEPGNTQDTDNPPAPAVRWNVGTVCEDSWASEWRVGASERLEREASRLPSGLQNINQWTNSSGQRYTLPLTKRHQQCQARRCSGGGATCVLWPIVIGFPRQGAFYDRRRGGSRSPAIYIHRFACQYLKVTSYRTKDRYDRLATVAGFQGRGQSLAVRDERKVTQAPASQLGKVLTR